jgi:hypothetical protein
MQFQLNIQIDSAGVTQIHENAQFITIVKNVNSNPLATGNLQVAWLSISPFKTNQITWEQSYFMYATTTQLQAGAKITLTSTTDAAVQLGPIYEFFSNLFHPTTQGAPNTYNLLNSGEQSLTFGLAQEATVNGTTVMSPLNATRVGNAQSATFTPIETVSIYLSSFSNNGVVISQVAGSALVVQLTSQKPVANIGFNNATNSFFLVSQTALDAAFSFTEVVLDQLPALKVPAALPGSQSQRQLRQ